MEGRPVICAVVCRLTAPPYSGEEAFLDFGSFGAGVVRVGRGREVEDDGGGPVPGEVGDCLDVSLQR